MQGGGPVLVQTSVDPEGWVSGDLRAVNFLNGDTVRLVDLSVVVVRQRTLTLDPDSIVLRINTETPDSLFFSESIILYPDPGASEGVTAWHETHYPYRSGVRLMRDGTYTFSFSHDSAIPLSGIRAIGMEISAPVPADDGSVRRPDRSGAYTDRDF